MVPTITSVTPNALWTAGQILTVVGTNFKVWAIPPLTSERLPPPIPTVEVTIAGVVATKVSVLSSTVLTFMAPSHDPGVAVVVVTNLDGDGNPIPGETTAGWGEAPWGLESWGLVPALLLYQRPALTDMVDLERVNSQVILLLRQQLLANVVDFVSVDYAETPFEVAMVAKTPALLLAGPTIVESENVYIDNQEIEIGGYPATTFESYQAPEYVNLEYDLTGITTNSRELVNLQAIVSRFFRKTRKISIYKDEADPLQGTISYDLEKLAGEPIKATTTANKQDIRSFEVSFRVLAVPVEGLAGFPGENLVKKGGVVFSEVLVSTPL